MRDILCPAHKYRSGCIDLANVWYIISWFSSNEGRKDLIESMSDEYITLAVF